ncbi:MAG: hypothetical protein KDD89_09035, partial [Anaerolineales bacterium]|nr:hypothetical protein [Anaerolineales bacterium]
MPYTTGHYANLPITTTAPSTRNPADLVDSWLDSTQMEPLGVSVSDATNAPQGELNAYVPLTQVTDEYGTAEAFTARMLYRPSQGSNGRADWGAPHSARLVWFVQMMTDECPAGYDEVREEENGVWTIECVDPETGNTAVRQDVLTIAHIYQDTWDLTGLTVSEEHGLDVAIIYEDPENDHDLQRDDQLLIASDNLNKGWLIGRDCDSQDGNGICQGNGQRDVTVANMGSIVPTWFTSDSYIQVDTYLDYDHSAYFAYLVGTEVKPLLETTFASYTNTIPTLMYAQDHTKRQINLDDMETGLVQASGNLLSFDLRPADVPLQTHATLSWTPYQYVNGQWQAADIQSYLTRLDTLLQEEAYFQPEDDTEAAEEEAYFKRSWVQMYYVSLWQGLSALIEMGNLPVHGRAADPDIPDALYDPFFAPGTTTGATTLAFSFLDFFKETTRLNPYIQLSFRSISPNTFVAGFTLATLVTFVGIGLLIAGSVNQDQQLVRTGEIILAVMSLAVGSVYAINALHMISTGAQGAATAATTVKNATSYQAIGVVGLGIILTAVWVMFIVQVTSKNMTEVEFNVALSMALATTIITVVLFILSLVGLGVLGIILGLIDAVFLLLNKKGPTQYVVEFIAQTLYDVNTTVANLTSGDRLDITVRDVAFVNVDQGFRETNSLDITMVLTNTLRSSRAFWDRRDTVTRRNHFTYTLTTTPTEFTGPLPDWDDPLNDQWIPRINFRMWTSSTNDITVPLADVGAGLNQGLEVYYNETFRTGYRACWYANIDCKWKYIRDSAHYPLSSTLVFDVFPSTIAEFARLDWGGDDLPFGEQADLDADGLLDVYGIDPSSADF